MRCLGLHTPGCRIALQKSRPAIQRTDMTGSLLPGCRTATAPQPMCGTVHRLGGRGEPNTTEALRQTGIISRPCMHVCRTVLACAAHGPCSSGAVSSCHMPAYFGPASCATLARWDPGRAGKLLSLSGPSSSLTLGPQCARPASPGPSCSPTMRPTVRLPGMSAVFSQPDYASHSAPAQHVRGLLTAQLCVPTVHLPGMSGAFLQPSHSPTLHSTVRLPGMSGAVWQPNFGPTVRLPGMSRAFSQPNFGPMMHPLGIVQAF